MKRNIPNIKKFEYDETSEFLYCEKIISSYLVGCSSKEEAIKLRIDDSEPKLYTILNSDDHYYFNFSNLITGVKLTLSRKLATDFYTIKEDKYFVARLDENNTKIIGTNKNLSDNIFYLIDLEDDNIDNIDDSYDIAKLVKSDENGVFYLYCENKNIYLKGIDVCAYYYSPNVEVFDENDDENEIVIISNEICIFKNGKLIPFNTDSTMKYEIDRKLMEIFFYANDNTKMQLSLYDPTLTEGDGNGK